MGPAALGARRDKPVGLHGNLERLEAESDVMVLVQWFAEVSDIETRVFLAIPAQDLLDSFPWDFAKAGQRHGGRRDRVCVVSIAEFPTPHGPVGQAENLAA